MSAPEWLEPLVEAVGEAEARAFLRRAAGMRLYVPRPRKVPGSTLQALGGEAVARCLAAGYAGDVIDVPSSRAVARDTLRRAVAAEPGAPVNLLAHRYGVTVRRVLQVRAEIDRGEGETPGLLPLLGNPSSDRDDG